MRGAVAFAFVTCRQIRFESSSLLIPLAILDLRCYNARALMCGHPTIDLGSRTCKEITSITLNESTIRDMSDWYRMDGWEGSWSIGHVPIKYLPNLRFVQFRRDASSWMSLWATMRAPEALRMYLSSEELVVDILDAQTGEVAYRSEGD